MRLRKKFAEIKIDICNFHKLNENFLLNDTDMTYSFLLYNKKDNKIQKIKIEKSDSEERALISFSKVKKII